MRGTAEKRRYCTIRDKDGHAMCLIGLFVSITISKTLLGKPAKQNKVEHSIEMLGGCSLSGMAF